MSKELSEDLLTEPRRPKISLPIPRSEASITIPLPRPVKSILLTRPKKPIFHQE